MAEKMTYQDIKKIDVSDKIEKKTDLSYLSWTWAWDEMKKIDQEASVEIHKFADADLILQLAQNQQLTPELIESLPKIDYKKDKSGPSVTVSVTLNGRTETETLPVMNYMNKSIQNPNSMDINKAHKRCFVKALALHGLGLYIYAGEDLPEAEEQSQNNQRSNQQQDQVTKAEYLQEIKAIQQQVLQLFPNASIQQIDNSVKKNTGFDDLANVEGANRGQVIFYYKEYLKACQNKIKQEQQQPQQQSAVNFGGR